MNKDENHSCCRRVQPVQERFYLGIDVYVLWTDVKQTFIFGFSFVQKEHY